MCFSWTLEISRGTLKNTIFYRYIRSFAGKTVNGPQIYWKSSFLPKREISLKVWYINEQYFNLAHAHKPKLDVFFLFFFLLVLSDFFSLPFSFPVSVSFYSRYLLLLISFLSPVKSWVLVMVKLGNWSLINCRYNGPFCHHFCTKNWSRFLPFAPPESGRYPNGQLCE